MTTSMVIIFLLVYLGMFLGEAVYNPLRDTACVDGVSGNPWNV